MKEINLSVLFFEKKKEMKNKIGDEIGSICWKKKLTSGFGFTLFFY